MTKVTFNTEELKKRLAQLGGVIAKKVTVPVYSHVRLFVSPVQGDGLQPKYAVGLSGVDLGASLTVTLAKATADGEADILLPFSKFAQLVAAHTASEVTIETDGSTNAILKGGKAKAKVPVHPLTDWPTILERPEAALATVALETFKGLISDVEFQVPSGSDQHTVTVAKVESTPNVPADGDKPAVPGALKFIATDGFGLAVSQVAADFGGWDLMVPRTAFEQIKKLDGGAQLTISQNEGGFYFDTELETLTISRSHGTFPPYEKILPKTHKTEFKVDKANFLAAVNRVQPLADQENPVIIFSAAENPVLVELSTSSTDSGSGSVFQNTASDEVDAAVDGNNVPFQGIGPAFKLALDVKVLKPFLERVYGNKTGIITLRVIDGTKIVDFQANEGSYRFLQMPKAAV